MGLKVIVVDDATFVRDTIKRTLRQFIPDLELHEAADGRKAVSLMKVNKMDLVLSDWEMPEMTGEEFLHWVREQPQYEKTPFVMVTSRGDRENVVQALQGGVSDYLTKPFTADELKRKVMKQLKRIGYSPSKKPMAQDATMSSLNALTGGKHETLTSGKAALKPAVVSPAEAFAKPAAAAKPAKKSGASFDGRAQLRFPNATCACVIRELSLQALSGFMVRPEVMPGLFDQAVIDMEDAQGTALGRLNAYVHSLQALENNPETQKIKITVRFVDNDPEKMELISKVIAGSS